MDSTTASNSSVEQVVVYLRISEDRTGAEAGVDDPPVFADNDISAYSGKKRPGYLDLLERVKLGPSRIVAFGTRVFAAGKWRALDTAALFKQQGAIRALGTAVIAAHPQLAQTLAEHGLTLDPVNGEVAELQPLNDAMSKRSAQIRRNLPSRSRMGNAAPRRRTRPCHDGKVAGHRMDPPAARQEARRFEG